MDATLLHELGRIVLYGLPTSFLVILLCIYLKVMYFKPFQKMLAERYEATEGARKAAEESLARANAKAAEFDAALTQGPAGNLFRTGTVSEETTRSAGGGSRCRASCLRRAPRAGPPATRCRSGRRPRQSRRAKRYTGIPDRGRYPFREGCMKKTAAEQIAACVGSALPCTVALAQEGAKPEGREERRPWPSPACSG